MKSKKVLGTLRKYFWYLRREELSEGGGGKRGERGNVKSMWEKGLKMNAPFDKLQIEL